MGTSRHQEYATGQLPSIAEVADAYAAGFDGLMLAQDINLPSSLLMGDRLLSGIGGTCLATETETTSPESSATA